MTPGPRDEAERALGASRVNLTVILPIIAGIAVRLAVVLAFPDMGLHGDETSYFEAAGEVVAGEQVSHYPYRHPAFIAFSAAVIWAFGPSTDAVRVAQIGLEGLAILGMFLLGTRLLGRRAGLLAAWLYALYPDYIVYSHYLWSETQAQLFMIFGLWMLLGLMQAPSRGKAVVTGLLWGLLSLTKVYHVFMLPLLAGWLVFTAAPHARRAAFRAGALAVVVAVVVITPWSVAMSLRSGKPVIVCITGPKNLTDGVNYDPPPTYDFASQWQPAGKRNPSRLRTESALAFIIKHPRMMAKRFWIKWSYLWSPNSYFIRYMHTSFAPGDTWKYGHPLEMQKGPRQASMHLVLWTTVLLTLALVVALFAGKQRQLTGLTAIYILIYMAMVALTVSNSRYRLPLMVFSMLHTAQILTGQISRDFMSERPVAACGMLVALASLASFWAMRLPDLLSMIVW